MPAARAITIPKNESDVELAIGGQARQAHEPGQAVLARAGITKRDLLQYYADVAPALLPHLRDRAMVMKRYPNGAHGECFFMKRVPVPHPAWIETCTIDHKSGNVIDFPMVQDLASLLWVVNLGCIDLNQWYARCDDVDRPDYLHFDLDPGPGVKFDRVRDAALVVRDALAGARHDAARQDDRLQGRARLRPDRARAAAEAGVDVREGARAGRWPSSTRSS